MEPYSLISALLLTEPIENETYREEVAIWDVPNLSISWQKEAGLPHWPTGWNELAMETPKRQRQTMDSQSNWL